MIDPASLLAISIDPLPNGPRADACGSCGLRRLPARHLPHEPLSTKRRQPGILMYSSGPSESLKSRNLSVLGPDRMDNPSKAHSKFMRK
jgi:hypothetical protein